MLSPPIPEAVRVFPEEGPVGDSNGVDTQSERGSVEGEGEQGRTQYRGPGIGKLPGRP